MSVDSSGTEANGHSYTSAITPDGRFVVFDSFATNLVINDTNGRRDVFVHDRVTGSTERVNLNSHGGQASDDCYSASIQSISEDGRFVAFWSWVGNLVLGDSNNMPDVFVHDRVTGTTELISVDQFGGPGDGYSANPSLSADARFVAFASSSSDLVSGDTNGTYDIFVRDRLNGTTELVSVDSSNTQGNGVSASPAISADGNIVAFASEATNLVSGDTNAQADIFVHDRSTGITERVSLDSAGNEGNGYSNYPSITSNGQIITFDSYATNLDSRDNNGRRDVFVHDRMSGITECVNLNPSDFSGNGESRASGGLSSDGRFVSFMSFASDLIANDTNGFEDVFVRDRATGVTERVSVDSSGNEGNWAANGGAISANGESVAFWSGSTNLVANDTNNCVDSFVRDRCDAIWLNYGDGLPGTSGVPAFTAQADPVLGSTLTLDLSNSSGAATVGLLFVGFQRAEMLTSWMGELLVVPTITSWISIPAGGATITGTIPNDPSLCQLAIELQAFEPDPGAVKGVSFTRGLELILGN